MTPVRDKRQRQRSAGLASDPRRSRRCRRAGRAPRPLHHLPVQTAVLGGRLDPDFGPARGTRGPGREGLVTGLVMQVELDQNDLLAKGRAPETPGCRPAFQLPKGFPRCF